MKLRPLLISLAVLIPAAGAVWWLQRPAPANQSADARLGQRVVDPTLIANATRVRIESSGKTLELARGPDERWSVVGTPSLPADASRLTRMSADLVAPKIERLVTTQPARIATLDLDSAGVAFEDAEGKTLLALDLGKTAEGGGRFIRYGEEAKAYLARINHYLDAEPSSWRDTALAKDLSPADIASVSIGFPDTPAPVVLSRTAADTPWTSPATPAGQQVKASVLTSQLGNFTGLRYTEVTPNIDPGVVAARIFPREVGLTTFSGRTVKFSVSRAPEPPAPPAPEVKEGETPPPTPPAEPRPVYVEVVDSKADPILEAAGKTHAFQIGEWIFTSLPASASALFEPVPTPPAAATPTAAPLVSPASPPSESEPRKSVSVATEPISVTTEPMTLPAPPEGETKPE